jgi:hypothetical protein
LRTRPYGSNSGSAMNWRLKAVLVSIAVSISRGAAAGQTFDAEQLGRLRAGEVLVDVHADPQGATGLITATIDIQAPPQVLWAVMLDCERSKRITPALKVCRVTEQSSDGLSDVREHVVQWVWPLPAVRSVFASQYRPFEQIRFQRIEGDLEFLEGTWQLVSIREGRATRLTYTARIQTPRNRRDVRTAF